MSETIGQRLRGAREARSLTLEEVSRATHIRIHYLQALEAGDLHALPSRAQARGFLRAYAGFLGLPPEQLLAEMEAGTPGAPSADGAAPPSDREASRPAPPPAASLNGEPGAASPGGLAPTLGSNGSEASPEAQAYFVDIGQKLCRQRELLGLSIEDVERQTRLRTFYLRALEAGDLDQLPSPVQGRGMLKNYASFLGLDPEPLLLRFAEGLQARLLTKQKPGKATAAAGARPAPAARGRKARAARQAQESASEPGSVPYPAVRTPSLLSRILSGEVLLVGIVVLFLAGFMLWGAIRIFAMRENQSPEATSRSISEVLLDPGTPSPSPQPVTPTVEEVLPFTPQARQNQLFEETPEVTGEAGETAEEGAPGSSTGRVEVYLTITQRTWLRVIVDGEVQRNERVAPDSAFQFFGEERVEVFTGNGAAVEVFFNGEDQGPLGEYGQVVYQIYTLDGMVTPTPTITPTPTTTTRPSPTPQGTRTLTSPTPLP